MALLIGSPSAADACGLSRPCRGNRVSAFSPTARASAPKSLAIPSGRYTHTNPLRREAGLRLLTESLPEPLRWAIIRAWRRPSLRSSLHPAPELPSVHHQRPDEASLPGTPPRLLAFIAFVELDIAQRLVEAPLASILPATRNAWLSAQGRYLRQVSLALAQQLGEAAALAEFQRLLTSVG